MTPSGTGYRHRAKASLLPSIVKQGIRRQSNADQMNVVPAAGTLTRMVAGAGRDDLLWPEDVPRDPRCPPNGGQPKTVA